jgi:hypothetical protein
MTGVLAHVRDLQLVEAHDEILAIGEPGDPLFDSAPCIALFPLSVLFCFERTNASRASSIHSPATDHRLLMLGFGALESRVLADVH